MNHPRPKVLLVLRLSALGDVAMTVPAIYSFARSHPDWQVKILTRPFFARIFICRPDNVRLLTIDREEYHGFKNTVRILGRLLKEHPAYVADLHNVPFTWLVDTVMLLTGHRVAMVDKKRLSRRRLRMGQQQEHRFTQRYFEVFNWLGFSLDSCFRSLFDGERKEPHDKAWVGIAPFARYRNKTYPLELMEKTVRLLSQRDNLRVFLFGGCSNEQDVLQGWTERIPGVQCVAGRYGLEEELRFMARLDVMVSMDSANMHLASIAGVRVISIWGSTAPVCGFLGWRQHHRDCLMADINCRPCTTSGSNRCKSGTLHCLYTLNPQRIAEKVTDVLNEKGFVI